MAILTIDLFVNNILNSIQVVIIATILRFTFSMLFYRLLGERTVFLNILCRTEDREKIVSPFLVDARIAP